MSTPRPRGRPRKSLEPDATQTTLPENMTKKQPNKTQQAEDATPKTLKAAVKQALARAEATLGDTGSEDMDGSDTYGGGAARAACTPKPDQQQDDKHKHDTTEMAADTPEDTADKTQHKTPTTLEAEMPHTKRDTQPSAQSTPDTHQIRDKIQTKTTKDTAQSHAMTQHQAPAQDTTRHQTPPQDTPTHPHQDTAHATPHQATEPDTHKERCIGAELALKLATVSLPEETREEKRRQTWSNTRPNRGDPQWQIMISRIISNKRLTDDTLAAGAIKLIAQRANAKTPLTQLTAKIEPGQEGRGIMTHKHYHEVTATGPQATVISLAAELMRNIPTKLLEEWSPSGDVLQYTSIMIRPMGANEQRMAELTRCNATQAVQADMEWMLRAQNAARSIYTQRVINLALLDVLRPGWENTPGADKPPNWYLRQTDRESVRCASWALGPPTIAALMKTLPDDTHEKEHVIRESEKATLGSPPQAAGDTAWAQAGQKRTRIPEMPTLEHIMTVEKIPPLREGVGLTPDKLDQLAICPKLHAWLLRLQDQKDEHRDRRVATMTAYLAKHQPALTVTETVDAAIKMVEDTPRQQIEPDVPPEVTAELRDATQATHGQVAMTGLYSTAVMAALKSVASP